MNVLSFRAKSNSCDEIPLNESFETIETSDQFVEIGNDSGSNDEAVTTLWSLTGIHNPRRPIFVSTETQKDDSGSNDEAVTTLWSLSGIQNPRRPSFASTETLKVRNSARSMPLPAPLYSASLSAMLESPFDFRDEPEPRAMVMPRPPIMESQHKSEEDECKSEFFDKMIAMKSDLNRRWNIETRSGPEERNVLATETVWVDQAEFVSYDRESQEDIVDETRAHAIAILQRADEQDASSNCNDIVWKAWGCNDLTTRRHIMCFMVLLFFVVLVVALVIGVHSMDEPSQSVSAANRPQNADDHGGDGWIGDEPDNKPSEETPKPKPLPTNGPRPAQPESPVSPTESPILPTTSAASPWSPTQHPALSPESGVSPSVWPSMSSQQPTISPTVVTTKRPTVKPTFATQIPTKAQRESTSSPSLQPSICQSSIRVSKPCYVEQDDKIVINFVNCSPMEGDWIGIWRTREDPTNLREDFVGWAWTCGTQSCQRSPVSKRIAIDGYGLGFDSFTAFLVHDKPNGAPYVVEAMSEPFVVTNFCGD